MFYTWCTIPSVSSGACVVGTGDPQIGRKRNGGDQGGGRTDKVLGVVFLHDMYCVHVCHHVT